MEIKVKKLTDNDVRRLGIRSWPIWEKEASSFDWFYDEGESCFFLEGEVEIETVDGQRVTIQKGDFVSFPQGLRCRWNIKKDVRKHYNFE